MYDVEVYYTDGSYEKWESVENITDKDGLLKILISKNTAAGIPFTSIKWYHARKSE